jgi:multidrug efflux pump subunit AcrA (membrane-fusion protein)
VKSPGKHSSPLLPRSSHESHRSDLFGRVQGPETVRNAERPRNQSGVVILAMIVLGVLSLALYLLLRMQEPMYRLLSWTGARVERGTVLETVSGSGIVVPLTSSSVQAPAAGTIRTISVFEGQSV